MMYQHVSTNTTEFGNENGHDVTRYWDLTTKTGNRMEYDGNKKNQHGHTIMAINWDFLDAPQKI